MGNLSTSLKIDGKPVAHNSRETYELTIAALGEALETLEGVGPAVPDVLREAYADVLTKAAAVRADASQIVVDLKRWDGDHDKAMAERDFRRGK